MRQEAGERLQDSIQGALVGGAVEGFGGGAGSPRLPEPNVWEDERAFAQRVFTARLRDYHAAEQALLQRWRANNPAPTPQSVMAEIQEQLSDRFGRE